MLIDEVKVCVQNLDLVPEFAKNNSVFAQSRGKSVKNKMVTGGQSLFEIEQPVINIFIFDYKSSFIEPLARINNLWHDPLP